MNPQPVQTATPYTTREIRDAVRPEWDRLLELAPGEAHFFQSHAWGEFKRRSLNWKPVRLVMEKDGRVAGAGQFLVRRTPLVPGALMFCPKGPCLPWDDEEAVAAFFGSVREAAEREGVHTVKIEPEVLREREDVKSMLLRLGFRKFRWDLNFKTVMLMDLSRSEEELLAGMKKGTRYGVRRAAREGVEVVEDNSPEALDDFWRMLWGTAERKGFWSRPQSYHVASWQAMEGAGQAHLFFAQRGGEKLAGAIVYTFGDKFWYLTGASAAREAQDLYPGYVLQWEMMRWAKEHGITHYDMMGVADPEDLSKDHPLYGVYKFKEGFGSEVASYVGCYDLPVKRAQADMWNNFEPVYYRLYRKAMKDIYY